MKAKAGNPVGLLSHKIGKIRISGITGNFPRENSQNDLLPSHPRSIWHIVCILQIPISRLSILWKIENLCKLILNKNYKCIEIKVMSHIITASKLLNLSHNKPSHNILREIKKKIEYEY